jgi:hypothetical protein
VADAVGQALTLTAFDHDSAVAEFGESRGKRAQPFGIDGGEDGTARRRDAARCQRRPRALAYLRKLSRPKARDAHDADAVAILIDEPGSSNNLDVGPGGRSMDGRPVSSEGREETAGVVESQRDRARHDVHAFAALDERPAGLGDEDVLELESVANVDDARAPGAEG